MDWQLELNPILTARQLAIGPDYLKFDGESRSVARAISVVRSTFSPPRRISGLALYVDGRSEFDFALRQFEFEFETPHGLLSDEISVVHSQLIVSRASPKILQPMIQGTRETLIRLVQETADPNDSGLTSEGAASTRIEFSWDCNLIFSATERVGSCLEMCRCEIERLIRSPVWTSHDEFWEESFLEYPNSIGGRQFRQCK